MKNSCSPTPGWFVLVLFSMLLAPALSGQSPHNPYPPAATSHSSNTNYRQDEVGSVMVALTAFPWEEVADQMNPNITRTTDQAIQDVQGISAAAAA